MKQQKTKAVILSRRNYRETDRIITVLTPEFGKLRLIAKGSRVMKSKLAGGIELFTVNDIGFLRGRGEMATLIYSRLDINFPNIISDINRVQEGYSLLRTIDRTTEDETEPEYFYLLQWALAGLNDFSVDVETIRLWFLSKLMSISGHSPNLLTDSKGDKLHEKKLYGFDIESMAFFKQPGGKFNAKHIKFIRLVFNSSNPLRLARVVSADSLVYDLLPLVVMMRNTHLNS